MLMPTWLNLFLAGIAGVAAIGLLVGIMALATSLGRDPDGGMASRPAPARDSASGPATNESAADIWPHSWTHDAPAEPLTADEAHHEMQVHRTCRLDGCARKTAAFRTLIEAGRVTPDTGRQKY
ncbi:hypothetical protein [Nocardia arizonensis]|uniref:hypothetical protein n=1 Tax=Nocardia arizonensis TaxID=1141647 RepID=UPI0006D141EE|nr:hypothetical protein [Nocardia arizonensis]